MSDSDQNTWRLKEMGMKRKETLMIGLQKKVSAASGAW
jgi:hypothetical protein